MDLAEADPHKAYIQGLRYLDEGIMVQDKLYEFLLPIIEACFHIPGFQNMRKEDSDKWGEAEQIKKVCEQTPYKIQLCWSVVQAQWGEGLVKCWSRWGAVMLMAMHHHAAH